MIKLDEECEDSLNELAMMFGIEGDLAQVFKEVLNRAYMHLLNSDIEVEDVTPSSDVMNAVDSVINFNAGCQAAFTGTPVEEKVTDILTWEALVLLAPEDLLVKQAHEPEQQAALVELYKVLPKEMWGGLKASELWLRQIKFMFPELGGK